MPPALACYKMQPYPGKICQCIGNCLRVSPWSADNDKWPLPIPPYMDTEQEEHLQPNKVGMKPSHDGREMSVLCSAPSTLEKWLLRRRRRGPKARPTSLHKYTHTTVHSHTHLSTHTHTFTHSPTCTCLHSFTHLSTCTPLPTLQVSSHSSKAMLDRGEGTRSGAHARLHFLNKKPWVFNNTIGTILVIKNDYW